MFKFIGCGLLFCLSLAVVYQSSTHLYRIERRQCPIKACGYENATCGWLDSYPCYRVYVNRTFRYRLENYSFKEEIGSFSELIDAQERCELPINNAFGSRCALDPDNILATVSTNPFYLVLLPINLCIFGVVLTIFGTMGMCAYWPQSKNKKRE